MLSKMHTPENCCVEPDHYRKYFRAFYWTHLRADQKCKKKNLKRDRRKAKLNSAVTLSNNPALLANPSQFAVFACVRSTILSRWAHVLSGSGKISDDSDSDDQSPLLPTPFTKLPKITGIGLRTVFALVSQARPSNAAFCELALKAMLDVLQGHSPEDLHQEPSEIIQSLHNMLMEVSGGAVPSSSGVTNNGGASNRAVTSSVGASAISALSTSFAHAAGGGVDAGCGASATASSCMLALAVARGDAELLLSAAACLIASPPHLAEQSITVPANLMTLQKSVQTALLGASALNCWLNYGVPSQSLFTSFSIDVPEELTATEDAAEGGSAPALVCHSLACDGSFLYVHTSRGLLKVGSGYGGSVRQHLYLYNAEFFPGERHTWLGCCRNKLYVRMGRKKLDIYQVDKDTLEIDCVVRLDPGPSPTIDSKSFIFTDGTNIGIISVASQEALSVKLYGVGAGATTAAAAAGAVAGASSPAPLCHHRELTLQLLRSRTLALGRAPFDELDRARPLGPPGAAAAALIDDGDDERVLSVASGQEFALLRTSTGKVYYMGKAVSLGYKVPNPPSGKWCPMKETNFSRNDPQNALMSKIVQVALGHEGVHAILVAEDGSVLFTGMARRGEDGDYNRHRRQAKPSKPKKMSKMEGYHVTYAACNYGSTALVTRQGALHMFGKDTQHCDPLGVIAALRHERVRQVALGKAHAVALTATGLVYTFGINNRGQCGREFGYTKERHVQRGAPANHDAVRACAPTEHEWLQEVCRVCSLCRQCTGFAASCQCAGAGPPDREPRQDCGCGEGDSGCGVCGVCRRCARALEDKEADDDEELPSAGENSKNVPSAEGSSGSGDSERESSKVTCLPPARVAIPGGHKIVQVACGLHHTVMLTENGEVMTFGANQYGQLGAGDVSIHHRVVRVRMPRAAAVAAGSNHTAVLTRDGQLYTFGNHQGGALGRHGRHDCSAAQRAERAPVWFATPGPVTRLGPSNTTRAVWVAASGDQTFVQVSQTLLKPDTLNTSTITANRNCIVILPNRSENTFKCITINKMDGSCKTYSGSEQVDFSNTLACLDPLYDVMWSYRPENSFFNCYNILVFDSHTLQKCSKWGGQDDYPAYGPLKKLEEFRNLETIESICKDEDHKTENAALLSMSILNQELAIPCTGTNQIKRMHAAMHLLGCMDTLTFAQDCKLSNVRCKCDYTASPAAANKDDFVAVCRFESHGGGWGYSGHSVEAIRFMVDTDLLLGGYGLFGGRGDYSAKIKLLDLGPEGGEHEGEGELVAESDEVVYECPPREKYPVLFDVPVPVAPNRWYVAWAAITGPSSDCGSSGQPMVVTDDAVFQFKSSKKSNNGTDVNAGQIPCLLYSAAGADQSSMLTRCDHADSYILLSRNMSSKITVGCFRSLVGLLQWAWSALQESLAGTDGAPPPCRKRLLLMKHQRRLTYVVRACARIAKFYVREVHPQQRRRSASNYVVYEEVVSEVRRLLQRVMAAPAPDCGARARPAGACALTFHLELTDSVHEECHKAILSCFYAFFPTAADKWNHLCSLLYHVKDGVVPASKVRELTSTVAAMCVSKSLREVLQHTALSSQCHQMPDGLKADCPDVGRAVRTEAVTRSASPATAGSSKLPPIPPPIPPRSNSKEAHKQPQPPPPQDITEARGCSEWSLLDVAPRLLDVVLAPLARQAAGAAAAPTHDHGERYAAERLARGCSKLLARIVAEMARFATDTTEESEVRGVCDTYMSTPSRFMRVNASRSWNTGNGSPDAICFAVDRPGVMLVGAGVYGGLSSYDYELELLHDVRQQRGSLGEVHPAHCWFSLEVAHGTFTGADCHNDIVHITFPRPVPIKEDVRYALRFCNQGGRTSNGDCGLPSVMGPDGTTFRFSSCSLSFNGSTLARGQLPTLLYCRQAVAGSGSSCENSDGAVSVVRSTTLKVASLIVERTVELLRTLRAQLTTGELRLKASLLHCSPAVNILLPYVLAHLRTLRDSKSVVAVLELVQKLLPQVAAVNLAVPNNDGPGFAGVPGSTTSRYYASVDSDHPYRQATVTNLRVLFPEGVTWVLVELEPTSATAQPEDSLTLYAAAGGKRHHCHCGPRQRETSRKGIHQKMLQASSDETGPYELAADESLCLEYDCSYVAVTPDMTCAMREWPQKSLLIPGNEVIFSLETATDYLNEFKNNGDETRFGFRALCVGYEDAPITIHKYGLSALEMELAYAGAACAADLLAPTALVPPLGPVNALELRPAAAAAAAGDSAPATARALLERNEATLLSRGLELSDPPTVHHVLTGQPLSQRRR